MKKKIRILCCGTFDRLHTGHISYLKSSKDLVMDSELIVIVSRDFNSEKIKGKRTINNERVRLQGIKEIDFVDEAVLGFEMERIIDRVVSLRPNILALGHDQWAKESWLSEELEKRGFDVRIVRMQRFEGVFL